MCGVCVGGILAGNRRMERLPFVKHRGARAARMDRRQCGNDYINNLDQIINGSKVENPFLVVVRSIDPNKLSLSLKRGLFKEFNEFSFYAVITSNKYFFHLRRDAFQAPPLVNAL